MESVPVFAYQEALQRLGGDGEILQIAVEAYLDDTPKQIDILKNYLADKKIEESERQAHSLKGASANAGAERLRAVFYEMELAGKEGDLVAIEANLPKIDALFAEFKDHVDNFDFSSLD